MHNDVSEHQCLVNNTCNIVHVSGNVDLQPIVGSQHDLAQLHNVFTQSLDSITDTEQVQQLNTMYKDRYLSEMEMPWLIIQMQLQIQIRI